MGAALNNNPHTTPTSHAAAKLVASLRPSAEILAELEQVEASIAEQLAKARG
ncbi:MAG: hypothetical protein ACI4B9_07235 [Eggerthellaceae bacterium]